MREDTHFIYVGVKDDGEPCAFIVDRPELKRHIAKDIARWVREGLSIERWAMDKYRAWADEKKRKRAAES